MTTLSSYAPNVEGIYLGNNKLTSIHLPSSIPALENLGLEENPLETLDLGDHAFPQLLSLKLCNTKVTSQNLKLSADLLERLEKEENNFYHFSFPK